MTTNPYASPAETSEPGDRAEREIRTVIRTFRMLAIFSIAEALVTCVSLAQPLTYDRTDIFAMLVLISVHVGMIIFSVLYLWIAARMAAKDLTVDKWARRSSLLLALSFPLFPVGLCCLPLFSEAGVLCYRKVKRYYPEYCKPVEQTLPA